MAATSRPATRAVYRLESPARLVRGILSVLFAFGLVFLGLGAANAGTDAPALESVVVYPGDTIWSLAERYAGEADLDIWVTDFANLNALETSTLIPGQTLLIPAS